VTTTPPAPARWTIRSLLGWMTQDFHQLGLPSARLDAELLIANVLAVERVRLYMDLDRPLSAAELANVRALVVRRRQREPVAYLLGVREFYRRAFAVSPSVLIPRPDTECLIERALQLLAADVPARVLDLCTGSGAIAVTLAAERPSISVAATDLSPEALAIALANAERHAVRARVTGYQGDLFAALPVGSQYDLITANPPYLGADELAELAPELQHEPRLALVADADGFGVLWRLCDQIASWLAPGGTLLFEVGAGQAEPVAQRLAAQSGLHDVRTHKDLGGIERVVEARAGASSARLPSESAPAHSQQALEHDQTEERQ
jgi:release factor glutamine methyltransferase